MSHTPLTREEVARIELGQTEIKPWLARVLVILFLATAALPACLQMAFPIVRPTPVAASAESSISPTTPLRHASFLAQLSPARGLRSLADLTRLVPTAPQLRAFEDRLNETSLATRTLAPWVSWLIKGMLHGGDEQVYFGRGGWLYYRPSVDSVTGPGFLTPRWQHDRIRTGNRSSLIPQPDPVKALVHFRDQLAARGIAVVVIPTPGKESLYPEKLAPRWNACGTVVQNPSFDAFKSVLANAGIEIFDPGPILAEMKKDSGTDVYLKTDTHWAPPAMQHVASRLAVWLQERGLVPASGNMDWLTREQPISNTGDVTAMLNLPSYQRFFPAETVQTAHVETPEGQPWEPDPSAPLLLMGDSFCNIYSLREMGWGDSAGFAEHLSRALHQPLDRLVINAGGAHSARQELVREMANGRDRLEGKRVVLYQFAARELAFGDWKLFDLPNASTAPRQATPVGDGLAVRARINAIARLPQPGSVPYKDCLIAIHLTQVADPPSRQGQGELLVYAMGMRDNRWLPVSFLPVGAEVRCRLRDWAKVEQKYGSYNRAELDDVDLLSLPTFWAEEIVR